MISTGDVLLALMRQEPLGAVAELANTLTVSAHKAGARDIEETASNVRRRFRRAFAAPDPMRLGAGKIQ